MRIRVTPIDQFLPPGGSLDGVFIVTPERGEGLARYTLEQVKDRALTKVGKKGSPPPPQVEQLRAFCSLGPDGHGLLPAGG